MQPLPNDFGLLLLVGFGIIVVAQMESYWLQLEVIQTTC